MSGREFQSRGFNLALSNLWELLDYLSPSEKVNCSFRLSHLLYLSISHTILLVLDLTSCVISSLELDSTASWQLNASHKALPLVPGTAKNYFQEELQHGFLGILVVLVLIPGNSWQREPFGIASFTFLVVCARDK